MAYATLADVRAVCERVIPSTDDTRITAYLASASRALDRVVPVQDLIAAGEIVAADARDVIVDAVLRRWRSPEGYSSETAGDYSYTMSRSQQPSGRLDPLGWLTDGEVRSLRGGGGGPRTVRVGTPGDGAAASDPWWP